MKKFAIAFAILALAACGKDDKAAHQNTELQNTTVSSGAPAHATIVASGSFEGRSDHITTGGVSLQKDDDGYFVVLAEDFSLDGAPDPVLAFGDGDFVEDAIFSELNKHKGGQTYRLEGINPDDYTEIYVWCKKFSVPLGVATLARS